MQRWEKMVGDEVNRRLSFAHCATGTGLSAPLFPTVTIDSTVASHLSFRMKTKTRTRIPHCVQRVSCRSRIFPVTFRFSVVRGVITRFYGHVSFSLDCTVHTSLPHHTKSLKKQQKHHSTMGKEKVHVSLVVIGHVDAGEYMTCCVKALVEAFEPVSL